MTAQGGERINMSPTRKSTKSSRSTAAKKAAATRKAKSAKRSTAAKKAAATRRAGTTKAARASSAKRTTATGQVLTFPTETGAARMDAITLLENDHRTVDQLFRQYEELADAGPTVRREPVGRFIEELSVHAAIEEEVLYPMVRRELPDGEAMANEALKEHQEAKEILRRLDRMDPGGFEFDAAVTQLIKDVRHHVEEEENEMFPKLRSALSDERLTQLGATMQEAKRTAPTQP
jgi:hemerythrin superfamily protein